jgi:prophage regulatory protein
MSAKAIQHTEPRKPPTILSYSDLKARGIKFSRQWLVELIKDGKFPKPFKLAGAHAVGFLESEIDEWIEKLVAKRDEETAT